MGQNLVANPEPAPRSENPDGSCVYLTTVTNSGMVVSATTERYIIKGFNILRVPTGVNMTKSLPGLPSKGDSFEVYELWACLPGHTPPGYQEPQGKSSLAVPLPAATPPAAVPSESAPPSGDVADVAVAGGLLAAVAATLLLT